MQEVTPDQDFVTFNYTGVIPLVGLRIAIVLCCRNVLEKIWKDYSFIFFGHCQMYLHLGGSFLLLLHLVKTRKLFNTLIMQGSWRIAPGQDSTWSQRLCTFSLSNFLVQSVLTQWKHTKLIIEILCNLDMQKMNIFLSLVVNFHHGSSNLGHHKPFGTPLVEEIQRSFTQTVGFPFNLTKDTPLN